MIQNKNLCRAAKRKVLQLHFDLSSTVNCAQAYLDPENATKVDIIDMIYAVATNSGTHAETIHVGIPSDTDYYAIADPGASQGVGTRAVQTLLSRVLLPAGTPLVMRRSALSGQSNTGEVVVTAYLETVDRGTQRA